MIRPIDIRLNAAHPELPLVEATTFTGAPSSVFIRGVPKSVGNWSITAVSVAVTYPDNTTTARAAVESAEGVWVATIPGTATSGRTAAGFKIMADGIDENGAAVTGYVLGFADFSVLSFTPVPAPGGTFWYLRYFDTMPTTQKKGDVAKIDGVLKFYNGSAWEPFADLSNCATKADATLTERTGTAWVYSNFQAPEGWTLDDNPPVYDTAIGNVWYATAHNGDDVVGMTGSGSEDATSLHLAYISEAGTFSVHADKIALQGYVLGSQADKPLASEAEAEALRTGKQNALSAQQLANIAAVPGKLDKSGGTVTGAISFDDSMPSGGPCSVYYNTDQWHFKDHMGNEIVTPKFTGGTAALTSDIPYNLTTKTISNNAVTLSDRAINAVAVSSSLASLTINFPAATSGKVRDFALRLNIASGVTAPELVLPQGVVCENADGEVPEISDGGTDGSSTILYFSETENNGTTAKFLLKGETLAAITQA